MRATRVAAGTALGLFTTLLSYACASEGDAPVPPAVDGSVLTSDSGAGTPDSAPPDPRCSADGWCLVPFEQDLLTLSGVWGSGPNDVWAAGSDGNILHWDGAAWAAQAVLTRASPGDAGGSGSPPESFLAVWGFGPNDVWAVTAGGTIVHCDGWKGTNTVWKTWSVSAPPNRTSLRAIWGSIASDVWMVGGDSAAFRAFHAEGWSDGPEPPIQILEYASNSPLKLSGISGSSAQDVWAVGPRGQTFHFDGYDQGSSDWKVVNSGTLSDLNAVWAASADDAWSVGGGGVARHWTHNKYGVLEWLGSETPTSSSLNAIWASAPTDLWVVGDDNTILHGDGSTWVASRLPSSIAFSSPLYGVWGSSRDDLWAVGKGLILHHAPKAEGSQ